MANRKVYLEMKVRLVVRVDEGTEVSNVVDEMEYDFQDTTGAATVEDTEILGYEITDSK